MQAIAESNSVTADRRHLLKLCAAAVAAGLLPARSGVAAGRQAATEALAIAGNRALIGAIADTIIPDSDTAGAVKVGVPDFIALVVQEWLSPAEAETFVTDLQTFDDSAVAATGRRFAALKPPERLAYLRTVQSRTTADKKRSETPPFFLLMKRLTIFGYYSSEMGASQELTLNLVPGEYQACSAVNNGEHAFRSAAAHRSFRPEPPPFPFESIARATC